MQSNTGRDTKPEVALRQAVHARGLRYYVNKRPIRAVRRTADLVFPRIRLAVFVDGCFWHGCPEHHTVARTNAQYWADKVAANRRRDTDTNAGLAAAGWTVIRVWEHEAVNEAAAHIAVVVGTLRSQRRHNLTAELTAVRGAVTARTDSNGAGRTDAAADN